MNKEFNRINWSVMHDKNYDGTCRYCGGKCKDIKSISEWNLLYDEIDHAELNMANARSKEEFLKFKKRFNYLVKKRDEKLTYKIVSK